MAKPEPTTVTKCQNPSCRKDNPAANKFCGDCGAPLKPDIQSMVRMILSDTTKDRELVEKEIAIAAMDRVWGWAKVYGGALGLVVAIFVATTALVGYSQVSDVRQFVKDIKGDFGDRFNRANEQIKSKLDTMEDKSKSLDASYRSMEKTLTESRSKLPELTKQAEEAKSQYNTLSEQLTELNKKINETNSSLRRIEDSYWGNPLPSAVAKTLERECNSFVQFLERTGFSHREALKLRMFTEKTIDREIGMQEAPILLQYRPNIHTIGIGEYYIVDEGFLRRPDGPMYFIASDSVTSIVGDTTLDSGVGNHAIEALISGLADYYVCSFRKDPHMGKVEARIMKKNKSYDKDELRNLLNNRQFKDLSDGVNLQDDGEVWGGAFWALRSAIGDNEALIADQLIFRTLERVGKIGSSELRKMNSADLVKRFCGELQEVGRITDNGKHVEGIRKALAARGLEMKGNR
jgi:hypothetical protein